MNRNETAQLAYQLWEQEGKPSGRDVEFWLKAEAQLRTAPQPPVSKRKTIRSQFDLTPATPRNTAPSVAGAAKMGTASASLTKRRRKA